MQAVVLIELPVPKLCKIQTDLKHNCNFQELKAFKLLILWAGFQQK